jgi:hypothetical protein
MPIKEVHFFSDERLWARGFDWYEALFNRCRAETPAGEFSTSYLTSPVAAERIERRYSGVRLVALLRHPVNRAYSHYLHDIARGAVRPGTPFAEALAAHGEYVEEGRYAVHLDPYLDRFPRDRILLLVYEDSLREPLAFVQSVYRFLGVESSFVPSNLGMRINAARTPRFPWMDRALSGLSRLVRDCGLQRLWWYSGRLGFGNRIGLANRLRAANAKPAPLTAQGLTCAERARLSQAFAKEVEAVERLLGRTLPGWYA